MIGKKQLEIGARSDGVNDFLYGIGTSDETGDGGFSPSTTAVNLIAVPGVLNAPGAVTDKSTNLTSQIICSCEDPNYLGSDRMFLDEAAAFYTWNGSTLTKQVTASSDLVSQGTTDFVPWHDGTTLFWYATTTAGANGEIIRWNGTTTLVENFWRNASYLNQGSSLSAFTAWRPLLVYERYLYVGDKNILQRITSATAVSAILTLSAEETISALGVDNASGKMLIGVTTGVDGSAGRNGKSKIYYYDGSSNKAIKVCEVSGTITSFVNEGDKTYVFYGNKFGLFTGSGIRYLRTLDFAIGTSAKLIYPHRRCVIDNTIYIAQNYTALAYGPVQQNGQNVFYPALKPDTSSQDFTCLSSIGGGKLGYSYSASKFFTHDTNSVAAVVNGSASFYSRKYRFSRPVIIRAVRVEYYNTIATGSSNIGTVLLSVDDNTEYTIQTLTQDAVNTQGYIDTKEIGKKTGWIRLAYSFGTTAVAGVRRFIVYYDTIE